MGEPRERFEAYLRAQVEGCVTEEAKAVCVAYHDQTRATFHRLWHDGHRDLTINDAVAVLALGEYLKPADPQERVRQGLAWLENVKGKRDE